MMDSILRNIPKDGSTLIKTGLYTSPHLIQVRERIRICGKPIEPQLFAKYFFEVWDRLQEVGTDSSSTDMARMPTYFRFLTLLAFHVFIRERVDVAIVEVGIGGSYDATNVLEEPVVTCVTSLGYDHQSLLGQTLPEIAWHKAGIFKKGSVALTCPQAEEAALQMLQQRAKEAQSLPLQVVSPDTDGWEWIHKVPLGLAGEHQKVNAVLAVASCQAWLERTGNLDRLPSFQTLAMRGLQEARWPGRAQFVPNRSTHGRIQFFLDGAHTAESIRACANWFLGDSHRRRNATESTHASTVQQCLLFNCTQGRNPRQLLEPLYRLKERGLVWDRIYFTTNESVQGNRGGDLVNRMVAQDPCLKTQHALEQTWREMEQTSGSQVEIVASIPEALEKLRATSVPRDVLVTGSLHLVGGVLDALGEQVQ